MGLISGGGGGGTAGGVVLFDTTLGADTATLDTGAGGIAGGAKFLRIGAYLRTDEAALTSALALTFNGDTGANYAYQYLLGTNATPTSNHFTAQTSFAPDAAGATATANYFYYVQIDIHNYTTTSGFKPVWVQSLEPNSTATSMSVFLFAGIYLSTSAITQCTFTPQTGGRKFKAGCRLTVLGL